MPFAAAYCLVVRKDFIYSFFSFLGHSCDWFFHDWTPVPKTHTKNSVGGE